MAIYYAVAGEDGVPLDTVSFKQRDKAAEHAEDILSDSRATRLSIVKVITANTGYVGRPK